MSAGEKKIVAVLNDLFFTVKIQDAAKQAGLTGVFVQSLQDAVAQARTHPALLIVDLNTAALDPIHLIETLKSDPDTATVPLLGYVSHVQADVKRAAEAKGCDTVVPRSAFSHNLPARIKQYA